MKLTQDSLPDYFTIADHTSSWYKEPTNTFNFVNRNSSTLVVTIGDSWTWGCDLTENNIDNEFRLTHVYGNQVARELRADWLNLALPATGNFWLVSMVEELAQVIPRLEYKKIYIIATFTGIGRWFNTKYDLYIDYVSWFNEINNNFDQLLVRLNQECVSRIIQALTPFDHVQLLVGTNYVDPLGFKQLTTDAQLLQPWYRVLGGNDGLAVYACAYFERISQAKEFVDPQYKDQFNTWAINVIDLSSTRTQLLERMPGFSNCHPDAAGHKTWATYILKHLQ